MNKQEKIEMDCKELIRLVGKYGELVKECEQAPADINADIKRLIAETRQLAKKVEERRHRETNKRAQAMFSEALRYLYDATYMLQCLTFNC